MPYIERVAESTDRVTQGKIYAMLSEKIIDDLGNSMRPQYQMKSYWKILPGTHDTSNQPTHSENQMFKIETVTQINGKSADAYSMEELLNFLQQEEARIDTLTEIKTKSKAINTIHARHRANIEGLVVILDKMAGDDE